MLIILPIMLCSDAQIFDLLCYALMLKFLTYYAQYYAHVKDLCLNFDCLIHLYHKNFIMQ